MVRIGLLAVRGRCPKVHAEKRAMDFNDPNLLFRRANDQLSCEIDGEIAILNLDSKLYFGVTDVAATLWNALDEPNSLEGLVSAVLADYEVKAEQCRADVTTFLGELKKRGLLIAEGAAD